MNRLTNNHYQIIKQRCGYLTKSLFVDDLVQEVALIIANTDEETFLELSECIGKFVKYVDKVAFRMFVGKSTYNKQVHGNYNKKKDIFNKDYVFDLDVFSDEGGITVLDKLNEMISLNIFSPKDMLFINSLIKNDWIVSKASIDTKVSESAFRYRINLIKEKVKSYGYN